MRTPCEQLKNISCTVINQTETQNKEETGVEEGGAATSFKVEHEQIVYILVKYNSEVKKKNLETCRSPLYINHLA